MKIIIKKPLITEKSMSYTSSNKFTFEVHQDANKIEILDAVKKIYKVDPISVSIINVKGKKKNWRGRISGRTSNKKKAVVTLKKGQKIKGYEIAEKAPDKKETNKKETK